MDKDIAQFYSLIDQIFSFVRGPGQKMEIGEVEMDLLSISKMKKNSSMINWQRQLDL